MKKYFRNSLIFLLLLCMTFCLCGCEKGVYYNGHHVDIPSRIDYTHEDIEIIPEDDTSGEFIDDLLVYNYKIDGDYAFLKYDHIRSDIPDDELELAEATANLTQKSSYNNCFWIYKDNWIDTNIYTADFEISAGEIEDSTFDATVTFELLRKVSKLEFFINGNCSMEINDEDKVYEYRGTYKSDGKMITISFTKHLYDDMELETDEVTKVFVLDGIAFGRYYSKNIE